MTSSESFLVVFIALFSVLVFALHNNTHNSKKLEKCPRSRIEVRPTVLLRCHAHTHWALTFDFQSQASYGHDQPPPTHTHTTQVQRSVGLDDRVETNGRRDERYTDCFTFPDNAVGNNNNNSKDYYYYYSVTTAAAGGGGGLTDDRFYETHIMNFYTSVRATCGNNDDIATVATTTIVKQLRPLINTAFDCQLTGQHSLGLE